MFRHWMAVGATAALALSIVFFVACSGSNSPMQTASPTTTMITISDPATCSMGTGGPFSHVYVTVTDVQIHSSASAGDNDSGWIDLTPNLKNSPQQVDLLGQANNQCFLASLGSTTELQPGTYQQIRVMLAPNNATVSGDKCNGTANCVVLSADNSIHTLLLSSESKTGLKIPSGQIAGGNFTVAAGQTKDLNIDFNTCASIVTQGNGKFRLKPVLHAGEVSTTSTSINGKLVDNQGQPIAGGKAIVALEQKDTTGTIDRVIMQTTPDSTGAFVFCPVPAGTYDVVAVAVNGAGLAFATTITTGVAPGASLGSVKIFPTTGTNTGPGSITGMVTSATAAPAGGGNATGIVVDLTISALQKVGSVYVTIPMAQQSSATATLTTQAGTTCPANTDCATYTLSVPGVNPTVGAFSAGGTNYVAGASGAASYSVEAQAFVPQSGGKPDCTPSVLPTDLTTTSISVTPGGTAAQAPTIAFTGCQ